MHVHLVYCLHSQSWSELCGPVHARYAASLSAMIVQSAELWSVVSAQAVGSRTRIRRVLQHLHTADLLCARRPLPNSTRTRARCAASPSARTATTWQPRPMTASSYGTCASSRISSRWRRPPRPAPSRRWPSALTSPARIWPSAEPMRALWASSRTGPRSSPSLLPLATRCAYPPMDPSVTYFPGSALGNEVRTPSQTFLLGIITIILISALCRFRFKAIRC